MAPMNDKNNKSITTTQYNNFESFIHQNANRVFRYWIYKRIYTPYEQDQKFINENIYENCTCSYAYIRECIALPDGDYLIGFEDAETANCTGDDYCQYIEYCKLSEIRLSYCESDSNEYLVD